MDDQQLDLFDAEPAPPSAPHVRIGTSGWHYRHWRGAFYPPDLRTSSYLPFYARRFDCVEINNSFYRLPSREGFAAWRRAVPPGFAFAVKASRYLTHLRRLNEPAAGISRLVSAAGGLGERLGVVLFQLPPGWKVDAGRLAAFLEAWPRHLPAAWEFREPSWYTDAVYELLAAHGAALCLHDMGGRRTPDIVTAAHVYLRFHGPTGAYGGSYDDATLDERSAAIAAWADEGRQVWAFFNNDQGTCAVGDASRLRSRVAELLDLPGAA
jgi:uncharacterized protein YecE (DUF72 family)